MADNIQAKGNAVYLAWGKYHDKIKRRFLEI